MGSTNRLAGAVAALALSIPWTGAAHAQPVSPAARGYEVEWVYRVKYGHIDEWWDIFRAYQIPILDREIKLGYVLSYKIYHPQLHTDEAARWDYRVEITYKDFDGSLHEDEVTQVLFPDATARKAAENRRWEMTENHWDLPIYQVDTTKPR